MQFNNKLTSELTGITAHRRLIRRCKSMRYRQTSR